MSTAHKSVFSGSQYLMILHVMRTVAQVLMGAWLIRYLGPVQKGILTVILSYAGFAAMLQLQTGQSVQSFLPDLIRQNRTVEIKRVLWISWAFRALFIFVISTFLFSSANIFSEFYNDPSYRNLVYFAAGANLMQIFMSPVNFHVMISLGWYDKAFTGGVLEIMGILLVTAVTILGNHSLGYYILIAGMAPAAHFIYGWALFFKYQKTHLSVVQMQKDPGLRHWIRKMGQFSFPVSIRGMLYQLTSSLPALIAGRLFPMELVGYFSYASNLAAQLWSLISIPFPLLLPKFSEAKSLSKDSIRKSFQEAWKVIFLLAALSSLTLVIFSNEVTLALAGVEFLEAVPLVKVAVLMNVLRFPILGTNILYAYELTAKDCLLYVLRPISEGLSYFVLIPLVGMSGLLVSTLLGHYVSALAIFITAMRVLFKDCWRSKSMAFSVKQLVVLFVLITLAIMVPQSFNFLSIGFRILTFFISGIAFVFLIYGRETRDFRNLFIGEMFRISGRSKEVQ